MGESIASTSKIAPGTSAAAETFVVTRRLAATLLAGLKLAVVAGAFLGLLDTLSAVGLDFGELMHQGWPFRLILAALGKACVTYVAGGCLLAMPAAVMLGIFAQRRCVRRGTWFWPVAVLLTLAVLIIALACEYGDDATMVCAGWGVMLGAALVLLWGLRAAAKAPCKRPMDRRLDRVSFAAAIVLVIGAVPFIRSPLYDASAYSVSLITKTSAAGDRPNVLWIVLDTVRADHMSCYGYDRPTTPFLEGWASHSLLFDRAVSNAIWTVPSHASMFSGRSVREHGADVGHVWLDSSFETIAEALGKSGYETAIFSNNPWVSRHTNLTQGFATVRNLHYLPRLTRTTAELLCESLGVGPLLPWFDVDHGAAVTNQQIAEWLNERDVASRPAFLFVNYMDAHLPYTVPQRYRRAFMTEEQVDRSYALQRSAFGDITRRLSVDYNIEGSALLSGTDVDVLRRQYDAGIRYLDDRVAELIGMFRRRGLLDNTIVVIASDHGEYLGTHGMWDHRHLAYDDVAHVALMVREPGRRFGRRVSSPVQLSDVMPTVLELTAGAARADVAAVGGGFGGRTHGPPLGVGGSDIAPAVLQLATGGVAADVGQGARNLMDVAGESSSDGVAITEYNGATPTSFVPRTSVDARPDRHLLQPQVAANDGRFKYLVSGDGTRELYDLIADPGELHNLFETESTEADRLDRYVNNWLQRVPRYTPNKNEGGEMSPATIDSLRDLGYAGQ